MSTLSELLKDIDEIEDDEKFVEEEFEAVRDYCEENHFELSEDDLDTVIARGLGDWLDDWKSEYLEDLKEVD